MALTIDGVLKPLFDAGGKYDGKVKAVIRLQVQPWHASSTLTHESALAVSSFPRSRVLVICQCLLTGGARVSQILLALQPCRMFVPLGHETLIMCIFSQLFKKQGDFFDIPASTLTPIQVRENLAKIAAEVIPSDAVDEFKELLMLKGSPNGGVAVTDDLKYTSTYWPF
jgi:hypothetical protein